jgi:hypothetical protein
MSLDFRPGIITLVEPNGREILVGKRTYEIRWSAFEYEPSYMLRLEYSLDGGKSYKPITEKTLNNGKYLWKVPEASTSKARVRISDTLNKAIYDISDKYFYIMSEKEYKDKKGKIGIEEGVEEGITEEGVEEGAEEEIREEEVIKEEELVKERPGTQLYELLIKIRDNVLENTPEEDQRGSYKEGDIVVIKPAGHQWSDTERNSFLIVQAYLTKEEVAQLTQPQTITKVDKSGKVVTEISKKRRFKINLKKAGLEDEKLALMKGLLKNKPLIGKVGIEEKK